MFFLASLFTLAAAYAAGTLAFRRLALPHIVRLGLGAALLSTAICALLIAKHGSARVFIAGGSVLIVLACLFRPARLRETVTEPVDRITRWVFAMVMTAYGAFYLVNAMAPEIQPDAITYHLGLSSEYVRLGRFPPRVGFYEMLPQGLEMLFVMASALGGYSAAKLVHFACLLGTVPLLFALARRLRLGDRTAAAAAALYFATPVAGISGSCAYNDAALVFFMLVAFYLMLVWREERRTAYLFAAGLAAGFCYAIKITGGPLAAACVIAALAMARFAGLWTLAGIALTAGPWLGRAFVMSGNPFGPVLSSWFPNPYFNPVAEQNLANLVRTYHSVFHWLTAPMEYALRGGLHGIVGPLVFLLPAAILALRRRKGALLFAAALAAGLPWFWNVGARFLLPAIPLLALMLAMSLPRAVLIPCILAQAVLCWPPVLERFASPGAWMLHEFPWRAALRIEPETEYLRRVAPEYEAAEMLETWTRTGSRIFALRDVAAAYTERTVIAFWTSTQSEQLADALRAAYFRYPVAASHAEWPVERLTAIRLAAAAAVPDEWWIYEVKLSSPRGEWQPDDRWSLDASPRRWETPWAFDRNPATAWRTRENTERGMFLEAAFGAELEICAVDMLSKLPRAELPVVVQGRDSAGHWKKLAFLETTAAPAADLRNEAIRAIARAGFRYVFAETGDEGMDRIASEMAAHPDEWGLRDLGSAGNAHLFEIIGKNGSL